MPKWLDGWALTPTGGFAAIRTGVDYLVAGVRYWRMSRGMWVMVAAVAACSGQSSSSAPQPKPQPKVAPPTRPAAAKPVLDSVEVRRQLRWAAAERGAQVRWRLRGQTIELCVDTPCTDDAYVTYSALAPAIAAITKRGEPFTKQLSIIGIAANARRKAMSRLFWALTELDKSEDSELSRSEQALGSIVGWLAKRYKLTQLAPPVLRAGTKQGPVKVGDVYFGAFRGADGARWDCGRDTGPSKYCCYVYCASDKGGDLTEGH